MTTRRRAMAFLAVSAAAPAMTHAQQEGSGGGGKKGKVWRIGMLASGHASPVAAPAYVDFVGAMRELGYIDGKHYVVEWRSAEGNYERFPALAADLVKMNVDVIVVPVRAANAAAKRATNTIPIVVVSSADPVGEGLAATLARPGGNITGLASVTGEASPQYLEFLRTLLPGLSRIALLLNPNNRSSDISRDLEQAAKAAAAKVVAVHASVPSQLEQAFATLKRDKPDALVVTTDAFFLSQRERIAQLALAQRLPSIAARREYAEAGFLMSYGESLSGARRRAAYYVDRIFKGAKPADLPFEKPMRLSLTLNRKTANALGIKLPQELLLRADEVLE